jgi:hypothetical protein
MKRNMSRWRASDKAGVRPDWQPGAARLSTTIVAARVPVMHALMSKGPDVLQLATH